VPVQAPNKNNGRNTFRIPKIRADDDRVVCLNMLNSKCGAFIILGFYIKMSPTGFDNT